MTAELTRPPAPLVGLTAEQARAAAGHMAREYQEATADLRRHLDGLHAASERLHAAFTKAEGDYTPSLNRFDIDVRYDSHSVYRHGDGRDAYAKLFLEMRRRAWEMLVDHLGIKNLMSVQRRDEFERQMRGDSIPDVTEEAVLTVIFSLADQAKDFAAEAAREVFDILRPGATRSGGEYKTNTAFRVGRRMILPGYVEQRWGGGGFRPTYYHEKHFIAIDGVFHLLDGAGPIKDRVSPFVAAVKAAGRDGRGETPYFRFRCFKNGNLHLEMLRPDLVKQLNGLAAGEFVLGEDGE